MGLDAAVYYQPNSAQDPNNETAAIQKRLGNASLIGWIAQEVVPLVGKDSVLFSKVLFSGSHSGDSIELRELDALESDISTVRNNSGISTEADRFLNDLIALISAAREHSMPIVFD
jgi:hypothetical protein